MGADEACSNPADNGLSSIGAVENHLQNPRNIFQKENYSPENP